MTSHSTVGVNDDLAARQTSVGMWPTQNELASWVDEDGVIIIGELCRNHGANHLLDEVGANHSVAIDTFVMLSRDENSLQTNGLAIFVIKSNLSLAVGTKVRNLTRLTNQCQTLSQTVSQVNR